MRDAENWPFNPPVRVSGPVRANSAGLVRKMTLAGEGIGLIPSFLITGDIADGTLVPLLKDHPLPVFGIHAVYPPGRHLSPGIRAFVDVLATRLKGAPSA
jgi:DNA-binding transcriptional LysR family regulator